MKGQWFGKVSGTNAGHLILNLDQRPGGYSGQGALFDADIDLPGTIYQVTLGPNGEKVALSGHADFTVCFDKRNGNLLKIEDARARYPQAVHPTRVSLSGVQNGARATVTYETDIGTKGIADLFLETVGDKSLIEPKPISWAQFKTDAAALVGTHMFRGQSSARPLRTSFHRSDKYDISRFAIEDMNRLSLAVSPSIGRILSPTGGTDMVALLGIAQHHGFPTPLLDWTKSPYIAAYFACKALIENKKKSGPPVVFSFQSGSWRTLHPPANDIGALAPNLVMMEPVPMLNPRVLQQQSVLMLSNVDDIERFVLNREAADKANYLSAWQLEGDPRAILRDLRVMGVYAGSMFPGLEGMCRGAFEESIEPY